MNWPFGLHGPGMHDFILREIEIGTRAAMAEDSEWNTGMGIWVDISYTQYLREHPEEIEGE